MSGFTFRKVAGQRSGQHVVPWKVWGSSWMHCGRFWAHLGVNLRALGSWRLFWARAEGFWKALGAALESSWALLGRSWALLGRSWPLLGGSWALLAGPWGTKIDFPAVLVAKIEFSKNIEKTRGKSMILADPGLPVVALGGS